MNLLTRKWKSINIHDRSAYKTAALIFGFAGALALFGAVVGWIARFLDWVLG